jgi:hypothetical protein
MSPPSYRQTGFAAAAIIALLVLLYLPDPVPVVPPPVASEPFTWDQDELWAALEARFNEARKSGCAAASDELARELGALDGHIDWLQNHASTPEHARYDDLEKSLFLAGSLSGACPQTMSLLVNSVTRLRTALKVRSRDWDMSRASTRHRLYRLLYGSRTLVEEILLQGNGGGLPAIMHGIDEPSQSPAANVAGIELHSGDILVSRGGAPVSALIARGNDYPGNFSHIALVHIDDNARVRVIEAHIEVGVTVSSLDDYLADKKLRIMVLRLDHTLAALGDDPLLPHRAASFALDEANSRHVPYDFAMYYDEPSQKFCSEVASAAYDEFGVSLWRGLTSMSARGVTSWLSRLGVEQFETHGPTDLEYDPQLVVVAEWRDPATLFDDHIDNAIIDAMLEGAERGDELDYDYRALPLARLAKGYSLFLNVFGKAGPIPEGMSATRALRAQWLEARHASMKDGVKARVASFRQDKGYTPPYWELVAMARAALQALDD